MYSGKDLQQLQDIHISRGPTQAQPLFGLRTKPDVLAPTSMLSVKTHQNMRTISKPPKAAELAEMFRLPWQESRPPDHPVAPQGVPRSAQSVLGSSGPPVGGTPADPCGGGGAAAVLWPAPHPVSQG